MREETKEAWPSLVSHTHLFLSFLLSLSSLLVSVCVLGYGWKRLDFDISQHLLSSLLVSVCVLGYGWKRLDFDTTKFTNHKIWHCLYIVHSIRVGKTFSIHFDWQLPYRKVVDSPMGEWFIWYRENPTVTRTWDGRDSWCRCNTST